MSAETFGSRLRELRGELTQEEVAERVTARLAEMGVDQTATGAAVGQWENGAAPRREKVAALEDVFRLPRGSLARLLGYVPADAEPAVSIEDAITADTELSREAKRTLRGVLRAVRMQARMEEP